MNVVIAAGGTLGHIRPAINVANKLIQLGHKVYFITLDKNEININKYNDGYEERRIYQH